MAAVVLMIIILLMILMMLTMTQTDYTLYLYLLSVYVFFSLLLWSCAAIEGGRKGCAGSEGLFDLPFSHTIILMSQRLKASYFLMILCES